MASEIESLQNTALNLCINYQKMHLLPQEHHLPAVFQRTRKIWENNELDFLRSQYCDLQFFTILLHETNRTTLLGSFSSVNNIRSGEPTVADILLESYIRANALKVDNELGLKFVQFFIELGMFDPAFNFLEVIKLTCEARNDQETLLECYSQFIYALSYQYKFNLALKMYSHAIAMFDKMRPVPNRANLFCNISFMYLMCGDYYQALVYANSAIRELHDQLSVKIVIKILRISSRVFIVNKERRQARLLIQHALNLSQDYVNSDPYIFAEVNMDYGFYLSQLHYYLSSIEGYHIAMSLYKKMYKDPNFYHIIAERDLAFHMLKLIPGQVPLKKCTKYFYPKASMHLRQAIQDLMKIHEVIHMVHLNIFYEARALLLERYAMYETNICTKRIESFTLAKDYYELCLKNYRMYFDLQWRKPFIKTVECLVSLGHVYHHLKIFKKAEEVFKEAEAIIKKLKCRSNEEYFSVPIHRIQLYRLNPEIFKRKSSIFYAIRTMEHSKSMLIRYEGYDCDILFKFYHELIELYKLTHDSTNVIKYETELSEWLQRINVQQFKPVTDNLPRTVSMIRIIDIIKIMNMENRKKPFHFALKFDSNQSSAT